MVGLSLVAVFAIAAIAATSASALPEWGKCEAKAGGNYTDSNCTVKAKPKGTGSFEWRKGKELANVKFTGHSVGSGGVLSSVGLECQGGTSGFQRVSRKKCEEGGGKVVEDFTAEEPIFVECATETNSGETSSTNKILNVLVKFTGCAAFGSLPCQSSGLKEGEIKTNLLKGQLGYISKPAKEAGVVLSPAKAKGQFAEFACPGIGLGTAVGVGNSKEGAFYEPETTGGYDGIISPITPVNTMTSEYTQVFTTTVTGKALENVPNKFEGKHRDSLEDYIFQVGSPNESLMWSAAGEEITNVNTSAEPGEIKA